ncbi:DUF6232 family protein [Acerihabitans sp. TG2]|uniref:DUF6232 family protein n=1 Tax=Acerihabitans sp. TG2 TaxID=3096008 RepID=UPI002B225768|nr:DUF6232 family protein [Acerihabitans sp. TG2]MEA9389561.1 DUF6232 family protein [Acerihabitans sp. TG2]
MEEKAEEKEFYTNGNVSITNARFRVGSTTYAMQGVTSVKKHRIAANKIWAILMVLAGLGMMFWAELSGKVVGFVILILGVIIFKMLKDTYIVILNSSSGESQALNSKDEKYIDDVINSLNDAIVHRG